MNPVMEPVLVEVGFGDLHTLLYQVELDENKLDLVIVPGAPIVIQNISVHILEHDLNIWPGQECIWSQLYERGQIMVRMMIQRPLQGNWIVITLEFGSNNITIHFPNLMEVPPHQYSYLWKKILHQ